jgi:hypothetical protein
VPPPGTSVRATTSARSLLIDGLPRSAAVTAATDLVCYGLSSGSSARFAWTRTTRQQHSRTVTRYQTDLTDAEWLVIAPYLPNGPTTRVANA